MVEVDDTRRAWRSTASNTVGPELLDVARPFVLRHGAKNPVGETRPLGAEPTSQRLGEVVGEEDDVPLALPERRQDDRFVASRA